MPTLTEDHFAVVEDGGRILIIFATKKSWGWDGKHPITKDGFTLFARYLDDIYEDWLGVQLDHV